MNKNCTLVHIHCVHVDDLKYDFKEPSQHYPVQSQICEICLKWKIETPERPHWRRSDVFIVNHFQISHINLVFQMLLWATKCWVWTNWFNRPANIYLFTVNNISTRKSCEDFIVFIINFELISHLFLVFLLVTLNR